MLPLRPSIPKNVVSYFLGCLQVLYALTGFCDFSTRPWHNRLKARPGLSDLCFKILRLTCQRYHHRAPLCDLVHPVLSMPYLPVASVRAFSWARREARLSLQACWVLHNCPLIILSSMAKFRPHLSTDPQNYILVVHLMPP